ncbi:hypothetical protein PIB30_047409 [Stylosanthes scabra]|uniref:Uncharacterized protein n=1 Tax=Stylosanthes scabra TaxID=79078 RepID=A0ABU6RHB7_9FABA|nr:hypothetical protein [Stylosanthes scabra]
MSGVSNFQMARNRPSPSAKGKANAYGPPTRASPRLTALRSQPAANGQPETPVTPTIGAPTSTLPPKKCPIPKKTGEGTSKAASRSFRRRSQRIAAIGRTFFQEAEKEKVIALSSDSEPEKIKKVKEGPEEDPAEAPQGAGIEEEDPEQVAEQGAHDEDNITAFWASMNFSFESIVGNDYRNYDDHLDNWRNAEPAASSAGSCTGPPPASY